MFYIIICRVTECNDNNKKYEQAFTVVSTTNHFNTYNLKTITLSKSVLKQ